MVWLSVSYANPQQPKQFAPTSKLKSLPQTTFGVKPFLSLHLLEQKSEAYCCINWAWSTCCKQLNCSPWIKPASPYCVTTLSNPISRRKPSDAAEAIEGDTSAPAMVHCHSPRFAGFILGWYAVIPRSHGHIQLVTHIQFPLSVCRQFLALWGVLVYH